MANNADAINDAIAAAASKPKRVKTKNAEYEEHSLADLIDAQKHVAAQEANAAAANNSSGGLFGMRVMKARFGRRSGGESD